jgi:hypothetical protein
VKAPAPRRDPAEVVRGLVAMGEAVAIGTDAAGVEQIALTPAGMARARRELGAVGAAGTPALDDETTARVWLALKFA